MVSAFQVSTAMPTAEAVGKLTLLPTGKQDVDGTNLVMLPGNWLKIDISALASANDIVAVQNPFGVDVIEVRTIMDITTAGGTATAVIDVDIVDGATDTGDDILDGVDANAAAISDSLNATDNGANGEGKSHKWEKAGGTNDHLTAKLLVAAAANLVAYLYVQVVPVE